MNQPDFFLITFGVCLIVMACVVCFGFISGYGLVTDMLDTRSQPCNMTVVDDTSIFVEGGSTSLYVVVNSTPRYVLSIADEGVTSKWKSLKPNDTINARLGQHMIEFCGGE